MREEKLIHRKLQMDQDRAPVVEALQKHIESDVIPFHVPGHKHGKHPGRMSSILGKDALKADLNAMEDIDDLANPLSCIAEAQKLAADAFGAQNAYFLINGTTSGIHSMLLSSLSQSDKILVPRDAHKSFFSGLILSGAIPEYLPVHIHPELGYCLPPSVTEVEEKIQTVQDLKAVFIVNPSYYGLCPDLKQIGEVVKKNSLVFLTDEAHGCHFPFHESFPVSGMQAGADMSAMSIHKTGGSLTQSSILLRGSSKIDNSHVRSILNILRTSSASYLLLASLDEARRNLAVSGRQQLTELIELSQYTRENINKIKDMYCTGEELIDNYRSVHSIDSTRLTVHIKVPGLTGYDAEKILRKTFNIQIELADFSNIVAVLSPADDRESADKLIHGLKELHRWAGHSQKGRVPVQNMPGIPPMVMKPRDAFYAKKKSIPLAEASGKVTGEMIMAYPPGIPLICPGESVTDEVLEIAQALKAAHATIQGTADPLAEKLMIVDYS